MEKTCTRGLENATPWSINLTQFLSKTGLDIVHIGTSWF